MSFTVTQPIHFRTGTRSRKELRTGEENIPVSSGRIPRISRLMALAIRIEGLIKDRVIDDYATAAQLGHVTRARMSQIMNLLNLAPDIQEEILFMPAIESGCDPVTERDARRISAVHDWRKQEKMWKAVVGIYG